MSGFYNLIEIQKAMYGEFVLTRSKPNGYWCWVRLMRVDPSKNTRKLVIEKNPSFEGSMVWIPRWVLFNFTVG